MFQKVLKFEDFHIFEHMLIWDAHYFCAIHAISRTSFWVGPLVLGPSIVLHPTCCALMLGSQKWNALYYTYIHLQQCGKGVNLISDNPRVLCLLHLCSERVQIFDITSSQGKVHVGTFGC